MENSNPMSQLPQLVEALLLRLEAMLADQAKDPSRRALTEDLLRRLRKQTAAMRVAASMSGEGLTPEQATVVSSVPVPQVSLFPALANGKKEK